MADNKELPPIGSMVIVTNKFDDCWADAIHLTGVPVKVMSVFEGLGFDDGEGIPIIMVCVSEKHGSSCCFRADMCVPVDTRTDKEKACEAIWKELNDSGKKHSRLSAIELAYDKWVGKPTSFDRGFERDQNNEGDTVTI